MLDQTLPDVPKLAFRSKKRDEVLVVSGQDLNRFLESTGVAITTLDFANLGAIAKPPVQKKEKEVKTEKKDEKEVKIGIEYKKNENLSMWYQQVLLRSEMLDYYDVSGCYIIRPWAYKVWKEIQSLYSNSKLTPCRVLWRGNRKARSGGLLLSHVRFGQSLGTREGPRGRICS